MQGSALRRMRASLSILFLTLLSCGGGGDDDGGIRDPVAAARFYPGNAAVPVSGPNAPGADRFDQIMTGILKSNDVPGATLAIARNGRLILARGYGFADFEAQQMMQPDSMFRIGSVSKVLTSVAVLHLKDQGLLTLDQRFLDILTEYQVGQGGDTRLRDITIRNLLNHSGGWDSSITSEPSNAEMARRLGLSPTTRLSTSDRIRYYMTQPLDFAPGTRFHYSNLGFCILGPVIERISGQPYEHYVRDNLLAPMDILAMSIGRSGAANRGPREVKYYEYAGAPPVDVPGQGSVSAPYAADLAHCPSSGSWIGSAVDLTRVMTAIDGSRIGPFLSAETMIEYTANPNIPPFVPNEWWGLGIGVGPTPDAWSHGGLVPGAEAILQRTSTYTWAVLTNSWPPDANGFARNIHTAITDALRTQFDGSPTDLYSQFPSAYLPPSAP